MIFRCFATFTIILLSTYSLCFAASTQADRIVVNKGQRKMRLYSGKELLREFRISLGREPVGAKQKQGDHRTPEGLYKIDGRNENSKFYRSLHISYPNSADMQRARENSLNPGGDIMIHGMRNGIGWIGSLHRLVDWTDGCIAVTDSEMDEIWNLVPMGTDIEIVP